MYGIDTCSCVGVEWGRKERDWKLGSHFCVQSWLVTKFDAIAVAYAIVWLPPNPRATVA